MYRICIPLLCATLFIVWSGLPGCSESTPCFSGLDCRSGFQCLGGWCKSLVIDEKPPDTSLRPDASGVRDVLREQKTPFLPDHYDPKRCGLQAACPVSHFCDRSQGRCIPRLCSPCIEGQTRCGQGGVCVRTRANPPESFCSRDCSNGQACPNGFHCFSMPQGSLRQCLPTPHRSCKFTQVGLGTPCQGPDAPRCPLHFPVCSSASFQKWGTCTIRCQTHLDCPASYKQCVDRGDGIRVCIPYCTSDQDCPPSSSRCVPVGDKRECRPDALSHLPQCEGGACPNSSQQHETTSY